MMAKNLDREELLQAEMPFISSGFRRKAARSNIILILLGIIFMIFLFFISVGFWYINGFERHPVVMNVIDHDHELISNITKTKESSTHNILTSNLPPMCSIIPDLEKFDCYPDSPVTPDQCLSRGCCYQVVPHGVIPNNNSKYPPLNVPYCFYPKDYVGYAITNISETSTRKTLLLERKTPSGFPEDIPYLTLDIVYITENIVRLKIVDPNNKRYEPPVAENVVPKIIGDLKYEIKITANEGIVMIVRKATDTPVFNINLQQMVYANQFLKLTTKLNTPHIFGLGENYESFLKDLTWHHLTLFNRDAAPQKNLNLYGSHPFYVAIEDDGISHGVFLRNSNAMEIILQPLPALTYQTIGGILDFFIFMGEKPSNVVEQYTSIVGRPFMPPYWSLGFHLCRWGYNTTENMIKVYERTRRAEIPLDVMWNDIDYMDRCNDFTYNTKEFSKLPDFVKQLHDANMHYVMILDPGVSNTEPSGKYPPYDLGFECGIFIRNSTGHIFVGKVWNPQTTVYPDFCNPEVLHYWKKLLKDFHQQIPFDGLWIDMNEPSNFYDGMVDGCPETSLDNPPYNPSGNTALRTKTLCMSANHYYTTHYNEHNVYAYREAIITKMALTNITNKRPFIISRATFSGQGTFSGHWSGDVASSWEDLRYSNIDLLNFNIFGMPMMGSDICGFRGNTTPELCARWHAVGAFYPFSRNHNSINQIDQDPVALGAMVVNVTKKALNIRYSLLPYLYTLFHKSHVYGTPVVTSLAFEFPDNSDAFYISDQFMWGSGLMIMPVLYQGVKEIQARLPKSLWYDYYTGKRLDTNEGHITLDASIDAVNLAVRGGHIIPHQYPAQTTYESRQNKFHLFIALDEFSGAYGDLFWDDGDSIDTYENDQYNFIVFQVQGNVFTSTIYKSNYKTTMELDYIQLCSLYLTPNKVLFNNISASYEFDDNTKCLTVYTAVSLSSQNFTITWLS